MSAVVNFADLKMYVVIFRVPGDDGDADHGVAGQAISGGEGLPVISGKLVIGIEALPRIADQGELGVCADQIYRGERVNAEFAARGVARVLIDFVSVKCGASVGDEVTASKGFVARRSGRG